MFKSNRSFINKIKQIEKILGKSINSWEILTSNPRHILFEIDNQWIFKFFKSLKHIDRKSLEEKVIRKIRSISPCQVPNIKYSGIDFFGYPKIKGQRFNDYIWRNMNKSEQSVFTTEIADFLKTLHNFSEPVDGIEEKWPPSQDFLYQEISRKIYPKLSMKAQTNISRYLDEAFADKEIMISEKTLVHGNFYESNIIVNNNKFTGVIDFEHAKIITPAYDFAVMNMLFCNQTIVDEIFKKYNYPIDNFIDKRIYFMILFEELRIVCSDVNMRDWALYRLEKKYGDMNKAQLHKLLTLRSHFKIHYKIIKDEGFKKYLLDSYNYRKQQLFIWFKKRYN